MNDTVELSNKEKKALKKSLKHVVAELAYWVSQVESIGLPEVRKIPG